MEQKSENMLQNFKNELKGIVELEEKAIPIPMDMLKSMLIESLKQGNTFIAKEILKLNIDFKLDQYAKNVLLQHACSKGYAETVELLLELGAEPTQNGLPLLKAVNKGSLRSVRTLIKYGVDINMPNGKPLINAIINGHYGIVMEFISNKVDSSCVNKKIISIALKKGNKRLVGVIKKYMRQQNML